MSIAPLSLSLSVHTHTHTHTHTHRDINGQDIKKKIYNFYLVRVYMLEPFFKVYTFGYRYQKPTNHV